MTESKTVKPLRFIPFQRQDIVRVLAQNFSSDHAKATRFTSGTEKIEAHFLSDFGELKKSLKSVYASLDPDRDTRVLDDKNSQAAASELLKSLESALIRANYDKVSDENLQQALKSSSLFQVRLVVEVDDFEEILLYTRGASQREETLSEFFGLWKRRVKFTNFDRVVLFLRLKPTVDNESTLGECPPGSTLLKLFQNVPASDLEMLFPNIRIGMRLIDKLMIGVPALVSGFVVVSTKLGATLLLVASLLGFWLGISSEPVELDKAAMIAVAASLFALGGYLWKQFSNYRNRKLKYTQALTENLYFKLLDNNAGVIYRVLDDAEDSEVKESILALHFLLTETQSITAEALDKKIQDWFQEELQCELDFEIEDALSKLEMLNLAEKKSDLWKAC
ncbi:MAG: TMEM143 family protein [Halioglobus sp.]